jgi:hypothetical protein
MAAVIMAVFQTAWKLLQGSTAACGGVGWTAAGWAWWVGAAGNNMPLPFQAYASSCKNGTYPIPVWVHHEAVGTAWDLAQQDVQVGKEVTVEVGTPAGTAQHSTAQYNTSHYSAVEKAHSTV